MNKGALITFWKASHWSINLIPINVSLDSNKIRLRRLLRIRDQFLTLINKVVCMIAIGTV